MTDKRISLIIFLVLFTFPFFMFRFAFFVSLSKHHTNKNHNTSCSAQNKSSWINKICSLVNACRNTVGNYASSPLSSRHGSQESLRHLSSMSSMNMLQTPTGNRDIAGAQKKKGIKSSLGRFFSKKEKVRVDWNDWKVHHNNNYDRPRWRESKIRCPTAPAV